MLDCTRLKKRIRLFLLNSIFPITKYQIDLLTHVPPEHSSPLEQAGTVAEHLHTLLAASQTVPVVRPTHDEAVPHMQVPDGQVSSALVHAAPVPHLHVPLSQVFVVPLHAATVEEHLQTLLAAST